MPTARNLIFTTVLFTTVLCTTVLFTTVSAGIGLPPSTPGRAPLPDADPAPGVIYTPAQADAIEWATSRFHMVGLDLPETEIAFHPTTEGCGHHEGLYENADGRHLLSVCIGEGDSAHLTLLRRRTVAHELAHAWEHETLDTRDREELMALLDTDVWYSADVAWKDRGGERLAETIVWGLYDQRHRPVKVDQPCHELHRDFLAITGHHALGPTETFCSPDRTTHT